MAMLLPAISDDVLHAPDRLTPAVVQAAETLGMYQAELARVLHLQCGDIGRLGAVRERLMPDTTAWRQAVMLVRLYQRLHALMEGEEAAMCHWRHALIRELQRVPLLVMVDEDRLDRVLGHVEAQIENRAADDGPG